MQVSPGGEILRTLMDQYGAHVAFVSSVTEHGDRLFLGNVVLSYVSYVDKASVGL